MLNLTGCCFLFLLVLAPTLSVAQPLPGLPGLPPPVTGIPAAPERTVPRLGSNNFRLYSIQQQRANRALPGPDFQPILEPGIADDTFGGNNDDPLPLTPTAVVAPPGSTVFDQINSWLAKQRPINSPGPGSDATSTQCTPFNVPPQYKDLQNMCQALADANTRNFTFLFEDAEPASRDVPFPLKGCGVGCVVGKSVQASFAELPWNSGSWSGKCWNSFDNDGEPLQVSNIITPGQQLLNWTQGIGGTLAYTGTVSIQNSLVDGKPAWVIDYSNSQPFLGRSLNQFRDELREVAPGYMLGKVFIKPWTLPYNPSPLTVEAFNFALFQTCDADGGYAEEPWTREIQ